MHAVTACEFSGLEWDEWVADGKKSPFLGPYVPNDPEAAWNVEVSRLHHGLVKLILPCQKAYSFFGLRYAV